jgi:hypothetical protein
VSLAIRRSLEEVRLTALIAHDISVRPPDLRGSLAGGWHPLTRA